MGKYVLKTQLNDGDVDKFINSIEDDQKREDCQIIKSMMEKATGKKGKMWGKTIVGFGSYHYKYASGQEGDWMVVAFSPRKQNISLYLMNGFSKYEDLLSKLGKHKTGKSCLYIKKLADVDIKIVEKLIAESVKAMKKTYKTDL